MTEATSQKLNREPISEREDRLLRAAREAVADARGECGGDGQGCDYMRGYYTDDPVRRWHKCGHGCPMAVIADLIEPLAAYPKD